MSTFILQLAPIVNWTTKQATIRPPLTPGFETQIQESVHVHAWLKTFSLQKFSLLSLFLRKTLITVVEIGYGVLEG